MKALTPSLGSNQFITKFDADEKSKTRKFFSIKKSFKTKVKVFIVLALIASAYANYHMLKENYVFTCNDSAQPQWGRFGHLMKKSTCQAILDMRYQTSANPNVTISE